MENKDLIYIFVILFIFFYFKNEIFCLKKEKFTDTNQIAEAINNKYKIDVDAIRNLSEVAKELQSEGLTIPGDLKVKGKLTVEKDASLEKNLTVNNNANINNSLTVTDKTSSKRLVIRNGESVGGRHSTSFNHNNTGDNYIRGKLQTDQGDNTFNGNITSSGNVNVTGTMTTNSDLTVKGDSTVHKNINVNKDLVFGGGNNWIIHPDQNTRTLHVAPSKNTNSTDWDFGKGTDFLNHGGIEVGKFRPKHGKGCGLLWDGNNMKNHAKAILDDANADYGDIVLSFYHLHNCNHHFNRGGFMSKTKRHDGHIIGTFTDLQGIHGEALYYNNWRDWKWK